MNRSTGSITLSEPASRAEGLSSPGPPSGTVARLALLWTCLAVFPRGPLTSVSAAVTAAETRISRVKEDLSRDAWAILSRHCLRCHSGPDARGGLRLLPRDSALRGGDGGPGIVPGNADESLVIQRARGGSMPPINDGRALNDEELELLSTWIQTGASWPNPAANTEPALPSTVGTEPLRLPAEPQRLPVESLQLPAESLQLPAESLQLPATTVHELWGGPRPQSLVCAPAWSVPRRRLRQPFSSGRNWRRCR